MKTLAVDPGTVKVGVSILQLNNNKIEYVNSWQIQLKGKEISERLFHQGEELEKIIKQYPDLHSIGLEETFINSDIVKGKDDKNVFRFTADSPLALSMSRGVVHYIGGKYKLSVFEYSNQAAKKTLTGVATAGKKMVIRAAEERFGRKFNEDESCSIAVNMVHILTMIRNSKLNEM